MKLQTNVDIKLGDLNVVWILKSIFSDRQIKKNLNSFFLFRILISRDIMLEIK